MGRAVQRDQPTSPLAVSGRGTRRSRRPASPPATSTSSPSPRPCTRVAAAVGGKLDGVQVIDDLAATVGIAGAAQPRTAARRAARAGDARSGRRARERRRRRRRARVPRHRRGRASTPARAGRRAARRRWPAPLRQVPRVEGRAADRAAAPARAATACRPPPPARSEDWKFGFVGSKERETGVVHLPPSRVSRRRRAHRRDGAGRRWPTSQGTIATFTVDRLAYSPSPPIVFAVVDFDGGGRLPVELTDVDASRGGDRHAGRDDVPPAVHRRRHRATTSGRGGWCEMASHGIKDRVAIVGMGCTRFVEHWDHGLDDLLIDAANEAYASAGIDKDDVDAYWFGTAQGGMSGITLARPLQLEDKPVTRVENYCATGAEALRQAAYAVASGAYDVAMAIGVEKTKDSGYQGLTAVHAAQRRHRPHAHRGGDVLDGRTRLRRQVRRRRSSKLREAMAHVAWKNHSQRRPQPARAVPRGGLDGDDLHVAAGRRHARRVRLRRRRRRRGGRDRVPRRGRAPLHRQAALREGAVVRRRQRRRPHRPVVRLHARSPRSAACAARRLRAGRASPIPRAEIALAEVHDCFTITELVLMEDLGFSRAGRRRGATSSTACSTSTASCRSTPTAGSSRSVTRSARPGLRMMFEAWLQLRGEAPRRPRQITTDRQVARAHPQPRRLPRRDGELRLDPRPLTRSPRGV